MAFIWTTEKISQLSLADVKSLADNAKSEGSQEVFSLCQAEIEARKPKPKVPSRLPEGFERVVRTAIARSLEKDVAHLLVQLANMLQTTFDFSTEKARALSVDAKRFQPHRLLNANGSAKVGGAQRAGVVVFDRYISYRLNDQIFALLATLQHGDDVSGVKYQVAGPIKILTKAQPIAEVRPYLAGDFKIGIFEFVEEYNNFQEAADRFLFLLEQVAPRR